MDWRQLGLFKGSRHRGAVRLPPSEFQMHCALADLLARNIAHGWMYTHIPLGEKRDPATAARLKRMGAKAGWPDFIFVGMGRVVFLELKRPGGSLSDAQGNVAWHIIRSGHTYHCTDDLEDAIGMLRDLGIVRARVSA